MSGGFRLTTNNRMELLAVIMALESLKRSDLPVEVYTDSKYVCEAINKGWLMGWQRKGFKDKKNPDLWKRLIPLLARYKTKFLWVRGHAGHVMNERCDVLATEAADGKNLLIDTEFELSKTSANPGALL
jgi:ribonuclease HI